MLSCLQPPRSFGANPVPFSGGAAQQLVEWLQPVAFHFIDTFPDPVGHLWIIDIGLRQLILGRTEQILCIWRMLRRVW
jgi:hypothetical protein